MKKNGIEKSVFANVGVIALTVGVIVVFHPSANQSQATGSGNPASPTPTATPTPTPAPLPPLDFSTPQSIELVAQALSVPGCVFPFRDGVFNALLNRMPGAKECVLRALTIMASATGDTKKARAWWLEHLAVLPMDPDVKQLYLNQIAEPCCYAMTQAAAKGINGQSLGLDDQSFLLDRAPVIDDDIERADPIGSDFTPDLLPPPSVAPVRTCCLKADEAMSHKVYHAATVAIAADPLSEPIRDLIPTLEAGFDSDLLRLPITTTLGATDDPQIMAGFLRIPAEALRMRAQLNRPHATLREVVLQELDANMNAANGLSIAIHELLTHLTDEELLRILNALIAADPPGLKRLLERTRGAIFDEVNAEAAEAARQRTLEQDQGMYRLWLQANERQSVGDMLVQTVANKQTPQN